MNKLFFAALVAVAPLAIAQNKPHGAPQPKKPAVISPEGVEAQVRALCTGYEYVPSKEDFSRLGPSAFDALEKLRTDPNALPTTRLRAVSAMAWVDSEKAEPKLEALASDPKVAADMRGKAALAWSSRAGARAVAGLTTLLSDADAEVRVHAAKALGINRLPQARKTLEEKLKTEQDVAVRAALEQSLSRFR